MKSAFRCAVVVVLMTTFAGLTGCSSSGPRAETAPVETRPTQTPAPTPTPSVPETTVAEPETGTIVSEEVQAEIPEDLELLNARGYLEDVFFETDRYDLQPEARDTLASNAQWLKQYPSVQILVEGHCDERNTREYNLALGERRASTVRDYLVFLGVSPDRIRTISYGEERPFALGSNEEAWALNRRAHFVITAR